ncbi:MAG: hypothetical protein ACKPJQ_16350 [Dolichospermum sp.]
MRQVKSQKSKVKNTGLFILIFGLIIGVLWVGVFSLGLYFLAHSSKLLLSHKETPPDTRAVIV